jgi:hypothetical protein
MPKVAAGPSTEDVRRLFDYDPETGLFSRRCRSSHAFPGDPVGCLRPDGYLKASVRGKTFLLHRLAIQHATGEWPTKHVDHINGVKTDNRLSNLRVVDQQLNNENYRRPRPSKRGGLPLGVTKSNSRWAAYITVSGKNLYLGTYDTPEQAHEVYVRKKRQVHAGCTL